MRDGHGSGRKGRREERQPTGTGYSRYKSQLDRLFESGKAGGHVAEVMKRAKASAPAVDGSEGNDDGRAELVRACRLAEDPREFREAVDRLTEAGPLPDDVELLLRVVAHPREEVALDALERIERLMLR